MFCIALILNLFQLISMYRLPSCIISSFDVEATSTSSEHFIYKDLISRLVRKTMAYYLSLAPVSAEAVPLWLSGFWLCLLVIVFNGIHNQNTIIVLSAKYGISLYNMASVV
jgi:hypothetical protein